MSVKITAVPNLTERAPNILPQTVIEVFDDAITPIAVFERNGRTVYTNAEMQRLVEGFGHAVATLLDLAPDDHTSAASVDFERFRAGRIDEVRTRYQILRTDGALFWADVAINRRSFQPGTAPLTVIQIVDITAEREAQAETVRNEARWEAALGAARQGVWENDARRGTVTYSRMWRRLRGMADDEDCDGRREIWLARLHPEDRERIEAIVGKQETGEDGYDTIEYRERHRDGHYVWILSRGKPVEWDENGVPVRTIGTDTDITRLKTVEAELALEKERLHVTLQSIADGVISTDAEGRVTFINRAAEKMTGWSFDAARGQRIETVFDTRLESQPETQADFTAQCLRRGRVFRATGYTLLKDRNGRARYVREIASPVFGSPGKVTGAVMVFRDSTQRRKLMRKLEYTATHDPLTDLDNRTAFEDALKACLTLAQADESHSALCLIDLDNFKGVNDAAGHSAGDALLKEIARILRTSSREADCVARLGGDEFGIILQNCSLGTARKIAQNILQKIESLHFKWQGEIFPAGASIGVASIDASATNATEPYRNADNACYAAKRNGRGCVVVFG